ncbi:helix-turn-helix domain-containing protein [Adlercreutzia caecimuris]|uniref:helix-turn-helix domain-containing protein n=1 Tax=Adlercreutzia caecimuris TaxID=671266 RepID=UPI001C3EEC47|nr:helix-turn-helix transcriptional regulator [Adlercreutzia caecimuris]
MELVCGGEAFKERVARNLKVERAKHGWTQDDLARFSGVKKDLIANYEAQRSILPLEKACRLAIALGCTTDALAGLPDPEDRSVA